MSHKFFRRSASLVITVTIVFAGVPSVLATAGTLDPTFDTDGKVTTDFSSDLDQGNAIAIQPDGKIVVAGQSYSGSDFDFALTRYNSDGSLDMTFDNDGKVTTDISNSYLININTASAAQLETLPGMGPITAQNIINYRNEHGPFARIEDITNVSGIGPMLFNLIKDLITVGDDIGYAVALQPDGRIILAGDSSRNFALVRYNNDGSLDTTFDTDGRVTTDFGMVSDSGFSVAIQSDSKIVVSGWSNWKLALARYNSDGSLDTTFDTDGRVTLDFGSGENYGGTLALQQDGKIILAGQTFVSQVGYVFAVARYNSNGSLDTTFDTDGKVTTDFENGFDDGISEVVVQADGKIIAVGINGDPGGLFALARYNSDGSLDTSFDGDGKVTTAFGSGRDVASGVDLQPDGKIVVAGTTGTGFNSSDNDFALARYNNDGVLDTTFGTNGKMITDFSNGADGAHAVSLQSDGKIILAGSSFNGSHSDFALARYDAAGSAIEVTIDVKPGRFPNRIELEKKVCKEDDNLYVAILTSPGFDAQTVNVSSLELGDPLLNRTISPLRSRIRDVDLDGDDDLALTFSLCKLIRNKVLNASSTELVLTGITSDGLTITGRDTVKVVR